MATVAELIPQKTVNGRRTLAVDDLAVESFEIPAEIVLDGDTFFSDDEVSCRCVRKPGSIEELGCVWNPPTAWPNPPCQ